SGYVVGCPRTEWLRFVAVPVAHGNRLGAQSDPNVVFGITNGDNSFWFSGDDGFAIFVADGYWVTRFFDQFFFGLSFGFYFFDFWHGRFHDFLNRGTGRGGRGFVSATSG